MGDQIGFTLPSAPTWWLESERGLASVPANGADTVVVEDEIRVSIEAYDRLDGASNICGIHTLQAVLKDGQGVVQWTHRFELDELNFSVNKDMNAHTLFPVWKRERDQVHRLHRLPGNRLGIYAGALDGVVALDSGEVATLECTVRDVTGNETFRTLVLKGGASALLWERVEFEGVAPEAESPSDALPCLRPKPPCPGRRRPSFEPAEVGWHTDSTGLSARVWPEFEAWRGKVDVAWTLPSPEVMWGASGAALPQDAWPTTQWVAVHEVESQIKHTVPAQVQEDAWRMAPPSGGAWRMVRDTRWRPRSFPTTAARRSSRAETRFGSWRTSFQVWTLTLTIDGRWARLVWDPKRNMATYEASDDKHPSGAQVRVQLDGRTPWATPRRGLGLWCGLDFGGQRARRDSML